MLLLTADLPPCSQVVAIRAKESCSYEYVGGDRSSLVTVMPFCSLKALIHIAKIHIAKIRLLLSAISSIGASFNFVENRDLILPDLQKDLVVITV